MKQINHSLLIFLCLSIVPLFFSACKKDDSKVNITLHDKPFSTIQSYIVGKWDLKYIHGGYSTGTYMQK